MLSRVLKPWMVEWKLEFGVPIGRSVRVYKLFTVPTSKPLSLVGLHSVRSCFVLWLLWLLFFIQLRRKWFLRIGLVIPYPLIPSLMLFDHIFVVYLSVITVCICSFHSSFPSLCIICSIHLLSGLMVPKNRYFPPLFIGATLVLLWWIRFL
jgi:hypothetical protein